MWGDEGRNHGHSHGQVTPGWPEGLIQWGPGSPRLEAGEESPRLGSPFFRLLAPYMDKNSGNDTANQGRKLP